LILVNHQHTDTEVRRCGITTLQGMDFPNQSGTHVAIKHMFKPRTPQAAMLDFGREIIRRGIGTDWAAAVL
jgi:hypothetical protein